MVDILTNRISIAKDISRAFLRQHNTVWFFQNPDFLAFHKRKIEELKKIGIGQIDL
ncbi:hypothetical protein D3C87_1826350 [compost metagenome]